MVELYKNIVKIVKILTESVKTKNQTTFSQQSEEKDRGKLFTSDQAEATRLCAYVWDKEVNRNDKAK